MARKMFLSDGKPRKKAKSSKAKNATPACPECGSKKGSEAQCSPAKDATGPWSEVLKIYICIKCKNTIPAHLWERWNRRSISSAKKEWLENYKHTTVSQEKYFKTAIKLLEHQKLDELEVLCKKALKAYPKYVEFWKLLGVAYGGLEEPAKARKAFLQALTLDASDPMLLANYVTSCFHAGDKKSGCNGIEAFFEDLDADGKSIVLDSLLEAVKSGLIKKGDLPPILFGSNSENLSTNKLPSKVTVNGLTLVYKEVKSVACGHGYAIAMRKGPEVATIDGYRFPKDKPVVIEILGPDSKTWLEHGLAYEKDIFRIRKVIESLVDENGNFKVHPNKELSDGFRIYGGF